MSAVNEKYTPREAAVLEDILDDYDLISARPSPSELRWEFERRGIPCPRVLSPSPEPHG